MAGQTKKYRLFKVAKELNVSTTLIVDHLSENGHEVANTPNTKLEAEHYDILLKEFASEKLMKEKAEQLSEKRKEEVRSNQTPPEPETPVVEEKAPDPLSADDLRNTIQTRKRRGAPTEPKTEEPQAEPEVKVETPPVVEEVVETPAPVVETVAPEPEAKVEPPKEETPAIGLKVVDKIDLDTIGPKGKRTRKKAEKVSTSESKQKPKVKEQPKAEPKVEKKAPPKKEVPVAKTEPVKEEEPAAEVEETVIRAGDNMPQLSGLTIKGKIELPGAKPKKEKNKPNQEEKKSSSGGDSDEEGGDANKKRRRRRKRKRKSAVKEDVGKKGGSGSGGRGGSGGKEKPTQKEVDKSIRDTFSQMGRGASRNRQRLRRAKRDADAERRAQELAEQEEGERIIDVTEFITANEFANLIDVPVNEIITKCFQLGIMVSINQRLDAEVLTLIGEEYGFDINFIDAKETELELEEEEDDPATLQPRSPIITVMGHVDHGKTTLLDHLRKTNVTSQEAGGITQHIGAYQVKLGSGNTVTFLDTPGHEAFTAMRARGAKATDVVIIVVAADDAVMPQTKEAINHAEAASVPIVFAINKIDRNGADPERIKGQLAEMNYLVEDWGGKYQSQDISALKGDGVEDLLEKVILESELLELKANPDRSAVGTVIEARVDKGRGNVATVLVQTGTLKVGDEMVAGIHYGKVRALIDQNGQRVKTAGPSVPVQMLGLGGHPQAGDKFYIFDEDGKAKNIAQKRSELYREQQFRQTKRITLEEIGRRRAIGNFKELNIIIRGDVDGSVEALSGSLLKLSNDEVEVNIIWKGVGAISEADVNLAIASDAIILAFNVRPNSLARALAEREEVDIRMYSVIYDAINDIKDALEGLLSPEIKEEIIGTAEVKEVFKVTKVGNVAGSQCLSGKIKREEPIRVIRDSVVIYDSKLSSLKRFKDDVKEVVSGQEFGFMVENYNDIKVGDVLECYHVNEIRRKL
ncbi:MAG: translation initiation factor IF-2 [Bacteroidia bacterium]|nr:translation initiation factor IF-2 [Bacteroidia bacterium]